jgi:hypothetical protein
VQRKGKGERKMKNKLSAMAMLLMLLTGFIMIAVHVGPVASSPVSTADYESAVKKLQIDS